jgi:hypothetical protein
MHGKHHSEEWKKDVSDKLKSLYASEENPWSHIDRSGEKNPMWGNHKDPWNKGKKVSIQKKVEKNGSTNV